MSIDSYALVSASNLVLDIALWDGVTTWTRPASVAQTIQLNPGEDCGVGYTYVFGGTPRFVAPAATTPAEVLLNDIDYVVGTTRSSLGTGRVATSSTSITVDKGKTNEIEFQRAALTGDVTASANSNATTIASNAVTYAKMQDVSAASRLLGRGDSGSGDPQEITLGSGLTMTGTTLSSSGGGGVSDGDKGDITVSGGGTTWTIDNGAVTLAKLQNITTERLLGRDSPMTGAVEEIAVTGGIEFSDVGSIQIADGGITFAKMQAISANVLLGNDATGTTVQEITCTAAGRAILDDADASAQRTTLGAAATSHTHGNISSGGAIGSTDGLVVKTGTSGIVETLALPAGKSVLTSTSSAGSLAWELASGLSGVVTINEQTYTANGTFTKSANCKYVVFEMCGGGGGGGNGTTGGAAGGGGGGGLFMQGVIMSADLGTTTSITIGAGGGAATDGSATILTNDTTSTIIAQVNGGRGNSPSGYTIIGSVLLGAFGSGGSTNAGAGRHGGFGPGGGGAGSNSNSTAGAGGRAFSMLLTSNVASLGGGAAGGATLTNGTNASVTSRGFGEGAGGGGGSTGAGTAGNGGNGTRGSGGGGGGSTTTTGGTGGTGGSGFARIIEVQVA
jgi:hypothetical protein